MIIGGLYLISVTSKDQVAMAIVLFLAGVRNYSLPHSIKTACRAYPIGTGAVKACT
jgi:hypothetical protein